jgi:hypothetical protein
MSCLSFLGRNKMNSIKARPVKLIGNCPAELTSEDEFQIEGLQLENPRGSRLCLLALSQIPIGQGIWQLQSGERFFSHVSCSGCTMRPDQVNRVVFLLGHADKWALCQHISAYLALSRYQAEPDTARRAKEEAIRCQDRGEYAEATQKMEIALRALKSNAD